jgi:hypothetical protein
MTRDEIIKLAKVAGYDDSPPVRLAFQDFNLERFAKLIAADEREVCAAIVDNHALQYDEPLWARKIVAAIREREMP